MMKKLLVVLLSLLATPALAQISFPGGVSDPGPGAGSSGTVNLGIGTQLGYYASSGSTISGNANATLTAAGILSLAGIANLNVTSTGIADVKSFGALCDGVTDDATAIQAAITSVANGGTVYLPLNATCLINSTLTVNKSFVQIVGEAGQTSHSVGTPPTGSTLKWGGSAGGTMLRYTAISGASSEYLTGIGLDRVTLNCASSAGIGLQILSARNGRVNNVFVNECTTVGVDLNTVATLGEGNSLQHIIFDNLSTYNVATSGIGIRMDAQNLSGNVSFVSFRDTTVVYKSGTGILIKAADNVDFYNTQMFRAAAGAAIGVDLSGNNSLPFSAQGIHFYHLTPGDGGVTARGTATLTNATVNNTIWDYDKSNNSPAPTLGTGAALLCSYDDDTPCGTNAWTNWVPTITSGSGTIGTSTINVARYAKRGKIVTFYFEITMTSAGAGPGGDVKLTLPVAAVATAVAGSVAGKEIASTGNLIGGYVSGTTAGIFFSMYSGAFAGGNGNVLIGFGTYESAS